MLLIFPSCSCPMFDQAYSAPFARGSLCRVSVAHPTCCGCVQVKQRGPNGARKGGGCNRRMG